jgi:hypothetical protein
MGGPLAPRPAAPMIGEHSVHVLHALGYTEAAVVATVNDNVDGTDTIHGVEEEIQDLLDPTKGQEKTPGKMGPQAGQMPAAPNDSVAVMQQQ